MPEPVKTTSFFMIVGFGLYKFNEFGAGKDGRGDIIVYERRIDFLERHFIHIINRVLQQQALIGNAKNALLQQQNPFGDVRDALLQQQKPFLGFMMPVCSSRALLSMAIMTSCSSRRLSKI